MRASGPRVRGRACSVITPLHNFLVVISSRLQGKTTVIRLFCAVVLDINKSGKSWIHNAHLCQSKGLGKRFDEATVCNWLYQHNHDLNVQKKC